MPITQSVEYKCDHCNKTIPNGSYINAMAYGCVLHQSCFIHMTALDLAKALELDDIYLSRTYGDDKRSKIIYI